MMIFLISQGREFWFKPRTLVKVIDLIVAKKRFGLNSVKNLASPTILCSGEKPSSFKAKLQGKRKTLPFSSIEVGRTI